MFIDVLIMIVAGYVVFRCFDIALKWLAKAADAKPLTWASAIVMFVLGLLVFGWTVYWFGFLLVEASKL